MTNILSLKTRYQNKYNSNFDNSSKKKKKKKNEKKKNITKQTSYKIKKK